jgi:hypothetical protein
MERYLATSDPFYPLIVSGRDIDFECKVKSVKGLIHLLIPE